MKKKSDLEFAIKWVKLNTKRIDTHHSRWPELAWLKMSTQSRYFLRSNNRLSLRVKSRNLSSWLSSSSSSFINIQTKKYIWFLSKLHDVYVVNVMCYNKLLSCHLWKGPEIFRVCFLLCFRSVELLSVFWLLSLVLCFVSRQRPKLSSATHKHERLPIVQVILMCQFRKSVKASNSVKRRQENDGKVLKMCNKIELIWEKLN